jgi:hypothetical protein
MLQAPVCTDIIGYTNLEYADAGEKEHRSMKLLTMQYDAGGTCFYQLFPIDEQY